MDRKKILPIVIILLGLLYILISISQIFARQSSDPGEEATTVGNTTVVLTTPMPDTSVKDQVTTIPSCPHEISPEWFHSNGRHYHKCTINGCDHITDEGVCSGGSATCKEKAICSVCSAPYGDLASHKCTSEWSYFDSVGHAHKCTYTGCSYHDEVQPHVPGPAATENSPQICISCNYIITPTLNHVHSTVKTDAKAPGCIEPGNKEYFTCTGCSKYFWDSEAKNEISDISVVIIAPLGHDFSDASCTLPRTCRRSGCSATEGSPLGHTLDSKLFSDSKAHWYVCMTCNAIVNKTAHKPGAPATETSAQICTECGYIICGPLGHTHNYGSTAKFDSINHWFECACGHKTNVNIHADTNNDKKCDVCEYPIAPETTSPPVTTTNPPVTTTNPPVTTTNPPVTTTNPPVTTTNPPVTTTNPPVTTTNPPVTTIGPPETTAAPDTTTKSPDITVAPPETTHSPETTTNPPEATVAPPATTTNPPVTTTNPPVTTTNPPVTTTNPPVTTTNPPVTTTNPPVTTTNPPVTTTNPPVTTTNPPETTTDAVSQEGSQLESILKPAQITLLRPVASGVLTKSNSSATIDYSNFKDGYVMVKYNIDTSVRLKVQIQGPTTTYTYNITPLEWTVFPLSDGNGSYRVKVFKNVVDNRYSTALALTFTAELTNEFAPFLRPNQYVNYENAVNTMQKAAELATGKTDTLEIVKAVYSYVTTNISYDYSVVGKLDSGYLPDLDRVLETKKGICFDYAALMTGMLRSQNIACKLVIGYANTEYHAWINVWTPEKGWVDSTIFFDGTKWQLMDPTYASTTGSSSVINRVTYTSKYIY